MGRDNRGEVKFFNLIAIIGAVLIFVGVAWLIAWNWHQIPDVLKVLILVSSTLLAFGAGVLFRIKDYEGTGRALLVLGAGLYVLSLFLISQIYHLASSTQHYIWILFLSWSVIMLTAYFLDSKENLVISLFLFFPWVLMQYSQTVKNTNELAIFGFIIIFLFSGILLYSLKIFHESIEHRFAKVYRYWVVFYFLLVFYSLTFQMTLPVISEYNFSSGVFSIFLISFIIFTSFVFLISIVISMTKKNLLMKEILSLIGVILLMIILILSTKFGAGLVGSCSPVDCYDFNTQQSCNSAPENLICGWGVQYEGSEVRCFQLSCHNLNDESSCNSAPDKLGCIWDSTQVSTYNPNEYCKAVNCYDIQNESSCSSLGVCKWNTDNRRCEQDYPEVQSENSFSICGQNNNKKQECISDERCKWNTGYLGSITRGDLPTQLWLLWIVNNFFFIGFIILVLGYGQMVQSSKIVNLGLMAFILEIISRYIGFWMDLEGYFAFSILAIVGGILLIIGSWLIPKWRKDLLEEFKEEDE